MYDYELSKLFSTDLRSKITEFSFYSKVEINVLETTQCLIKLWMMKKKVILTESRIVRGKPCGQNYLTTPAALRR